jgi:hypothetical protein
MLSLFASCARLLLRQQAIEQLSPAQAVGHTDGDFELLGALLDMPPEIGVPERGLAECGSPGNSDRSLLQRGYLHLDVLHRAQHGKQEGHDGPHRLRGHDHAHQCHLGAFEQIELLGLAQFGNADPLDVGNADPVVVGEQDALDGVFCVVPDDAAGDAIASGQIHKSIHVFSSPILGQ